MKGEDNLPPLPPLRDIIADYDLGALKRFGQHFLLDLNITTKIARSAGPLDDVAIWEVGPGPGGLTRALLDQGASKIVAVERDFRFTPALEQLQAAYPGKLDLLTADALDVCETDHLPARPCKVIANLPFNVATTLLFKWLSADPWPPWFTSLSLMFQKEVADRLSAAPGTKTFGRLSVATQWRCEVRHLFNVPARAFTPPPKVDSSVVHLTPRPNKTDRRLAEAIETVARAAFGQRRKMLRTSLRAIFPQTEETLLTYNINPTLRAENLSIDDYETLGRVLVEISRLDSC